MRNVLFLAGLALGTTAPALAQQAATPPELAGVASAREGVTAQRLAFEYFTASPDALMSVVKITIAPGQFIPMHTHSGPEFHYVISGVLEETVGNEPPRLLKAGEGHYAAGAVPHALKNTGSEPATFLAFIAGKKGERLTTPFKK